MSWQTTLAGSIVMGVLLDWMGVGLADNIANGRGLRA